MTHVFVFDVDDTLYLERSYVRSGFEAVGKWLALRHGILGFSDTAFSLFERGVRGDTFDRALEALGATDRAPVPELVRAYREHVPDIALLPDASEALDRCRALGAGIALLSDGPIASQRNKVAALGLPDRVDLVVLSDAFGRHAWKPSEIPYKEVQRAFTRASGFTYLADNPRKDFITPNALGWRTVRVKRPGGEHLNVVAENGHEAEILVESLAEVDFEALMRSR